MSHLLRRYTARLPRHVDVTTRQIGIVSAGHILRLALGLVSSALLARGLGPEGMSTFSVVSAAMMIAVTLSDFGLSHSAIRYIARNASINPERARRTANAYARLKLLGAGIVAGILVLAAGPVARLLRLPPEPGSTLLLLAALGLLTAAFSGLVDTILRALRRFKRSVLIQLSNISLTVVLTAALYLSGRLDVIAALIVGASTALFAACIGLFLLPPPWRRVFRVARGSLNEEGRHLLTFSSWLWVSAILSIVFTQLDLLMLNSRMLPQIVGHYALALNLAFKADIVNQAMHAVLMPTVSAFSHRADYLAHLRRSLLRSGLLSLGLLAGLPLARPFILLFYGEPFAPSVGVFYALMSVILIDLLTIPLLLLAFPMNLPHLIVAADVLRILILILISSITIPWLGIYGPVVAKFAAKLGGALLLGGVVAGKLRGMPN
jgi:O-antigen/teichoic acid export membrane protein